MNLEIEHRERDNIHILDMRGRIVMGQEAGQFRAAMEPLLLGNPPRIVIGMERVDYVDSTGLGALVVCSSAARKAEGAVKLLKTNFRNLELLVTTKLETIFENYLDEQDAVNSFFPERNIKKFDILAFVRAQRGD